MRKKDKAICIHKAGTGGWGEHNQEPTSKNVRQLMRFPNREKTKVKYADVVCSSSPATDVTGIVNCKCFYLVELFSLVKITKIHTKPRMGLEEKDPNKQILTNGRSLDEEAVNKEHWQASRKL